MMMIVPTETAAWQRLNSVQSSDILIFDFNYHRQTKAN